MSKHVVAPPRWTVAGAATGILALGGFMLAHSLLIPWANPRFLVGAAFQGTIPALVGGVAAGWLYQRAAPPRPFTPLAGGAFGLALWIPIFPMAVIALTLGPWKADEGGVGPILAVLAVTAALVGLVGWRSMGSGRMAAGWVLAMLPGAMFIGGAALDAGPGQTATLLTISTVAVYVVCGMLLSLLLPTSARRG